MKALAETVFIGEIVLQSKIAELAAKRLSAIKENFDQIEVWSSIQSILVAAGNVSKILWPSKEYAERGERLRELLKVDDNNILSDRSLRNHFEHYDERIEKWFKEKSSAVYSDLAVDPFKSIQLKILEKRNAVNLVKATQDFLLKLRSNPNTQQMDYLIKTFMRIIFKGIYIQNQEIVKVDINQPWKMCYDEALKCRHGEEGVKCQKKSETTPKRAKIKTNRSTETEPKAKVPRRESVYFCVPSDVR